MPRRSRIIVPGVPFHIIQRGNNRQSCFFADEDYQFYIEWLKEYSQSAGCSIHAYVLMTNHVLYQNLGHDNEERQFAYRELFRHELEPEKIDKIRKATNGNFALGLNRFIEEVSKMLGRRVTPGKAGRPRKKPVVSKQK